MEKFKNKLISFLIYVSLNIIYLSCKKHFYGEKELPKEPCVVLFWHGKLAMMAFIFSYIKKFGYSKKPYVLISKHKDGEIISNVMKFFGINSIRGSTFDSPLQALREIKLLLQAGHDIYITPDGPRGPYHSISTGSFKIAQKHKTPIVIIDNSASRFFQAKSWDKMILAKPFSKIAYIISKPVFLDENEPENSLKEAFLQLENELKEKGFYV